jgi:hypothetical protein
MTQITQMSISDFRMRISDFVACYRRFLFPMLERGKRSTSLNETASQNSKTAFRNTKYLFFLVCAICVTGGYSSANAQKVIDKMVATVNAGVKTDLITYSDLLWQLALQPETPIDSARSTDLNNALRILIDQRLILQEAEKLPTIAPTPKEVADARDELARYFSSTAEFQQRLQKVGLTSEKLDEILEQRLKMEKYLSFRFQNFVVITQQEIADYYKDVYIPRFRMRFPGRILPTLEEARAEIETLLTEAKIESDTDAFLDTARERAEIIILNPV